MRRRRRMLGLTVVPLVLFAVAVGGTGSAAADTHSGGPTPHDVTFAGVR